MAIDSAEKRYSMMNMFTGFGLHLPMFEVDGSVDADDQYHMLDIYSGISLDAPVAVTTKVHFRRFGESGIEAYKLEENRRRKKLGGG